MKIRSKKNNFFLSTTSLDQKYFKRQKSFYLGYFCISDKSNLRLFNSKNVLVEHWGTKKKILSKYSFLKDTTNYLFTFLVKKLNKIHNTNKSEDYWRIIIYPWVCYYVTTLYDRWQIISQLKKKCKNSYFHTCEYESKHNLLEIGDINEWWIKTQSDQFNNQMFNKIIKLRKIKKIKIIKKKISKFPNNEINYIFKENFTIKNTIKKFLVFLSDKVLNNIGIIFNKIYFDKVNFKKFFFLRLCFENFQIPVKNFNFFNTTNFNKSYDKELRKKLRFDQKMRSDFYSFLFNEIKNYLPRSYLENYKIFLKSHRKIFKKRRLFIGSYSVQFDDCFKIFFAESRSNGSRYIMAGHGAGIHASRDAIYDHFYNISDKVICSSRKAIEKKKHTYVGLDIFKKLEHKNEKDKKSKILINFHEFSKFVFRTPVTTPPFSEEVENFKKTIKGFKLLNKESKKNLRFRVKGHYGLNSKQRFAKVFGKNSIEKIDSINFTDSLRESKLVVCFIPQTSYIESIYNNIPTILVGNKESFFDTSKRLKILKSLKKNNLYFDNMEQAANFINKNWNNIDFWWNSKNLQKFIKGFLKKNYDISENNYDLMKKLIKAELNKIK